MKARHRAPFRWILAFGLLSTLFIAYLHFGLFPGRLKPTAVRTINDLTDTKVDFDKILILPFNGLSLYGLSVRDKADHPLFSAKKLSVNVRLLPFLKKKKIIITNVALESPVYDAVLEPNKIVMAFPPPMTQISGQIPVLIASDENKISLSAIEEGPDFFLPENVYLEQIEIANGFVAIRRKPGDPPIEEIHSINVRMAFQKPPELLFDGFVRLGQLPYAKISLKGAWNLKTGVYAFYLQTRSDKIPDWLLAYQKNNFLILKNGRFLLETHLSSTNDGQAFFRSQTQFYDSLINLRGTEYSGRMNISAKGLFDMDSKVFKRYKGNLDFIDVDVKNLSEKIPELKKLSGKIVFEPDLLTIDGITGRYQNLAFKAYGALRNFKELILEATIYTDSKIGEVLALLSKEQKKLIGKLEIQGNCQAVTTVRGTLRNPKTLEMGNKILVRDGSIVSPDKKVNLSKISAQILVDKSGFRISRCGFSAAEKIYSLNAFIPKSPDALRTCEVYSKDFNLKAVYTLDNGALLIKKGTANTSGISSTFHGRISNLSDPYLTLEGNTEIILNRTKKLLAVYAPSLKDTGLDGTLNGPFMLKGLWNNPIGWDLSADLSGDPVFFKKNIRLDGLRILLQMKDRIVHIPYLRAQSYHGTLGANLWLDPSKPEIPFEAKIFVNNLNLNNLSYDLAMKEKDLAGTVVFHAAIKGALKSPEKYSGSGSMNIRDGRLLKTDLFKSMGELPFLRVEGLDSVTFHGLTMTFDIHDKRFWTQNLYLSSDTVDLSLKGSIGFDQKLDLLMDIQYSKNVLLGAMDTGGLAPFIVGQAGDFISQYRVSGTLKDPKYDKAELPMGRVIGKRISNLLNAAV